MWGKSKEFLTTQIQSGVVDSSVPISDVLRRAKILANLLRNTELRKWVDAELGGYDTTVNLPDYRTFEPVNYGTFSGPFGKLIRNLQIPVTHLPDEVREFASRMDVVQSVKAIEASVASATRENAYIFPWPPEAVILARGHITMSDGCVLVEAWKPFTTGQMESILDQIRNRLLDFLLELQQMDPEVMKSEDAIRAVPNDKVQSVFNMTILGGQNVVATGTGFTQNTTQTVRVGDAQSLCDHLRSLGIREDALGELQAALTQDGERPRQELGDAVKSWLGRMAARAVEGSWSVATSTALDLLKTALFAYYGWN